MNIQTSIYPPKRRVAKQPFSDLVCYKGIKLYQLYFDFFFPLFARPIAQITGFAQIYIATEIVLTEITNHAKI